MLFLDTLRRRLLVGGSLALLAILTACGGTADVNEVAPTVNTPPTFTTPPAAQTLNASAGGTASFSVTATGTPASITYAWTLAGTPVGSGTFTANGTCTGTAALSNGGATLTLSSLATACVGVLTVGVTASNGALPNATASTTLTVNAAPQITQPPLAQTINAGGGATFTATATGSPTPTYAWTLNGTALGTGSITIGTCSVISSTSNGGASLSLTSVSFQCDGAAVGLTVSNGINPNATASTTLTVNSAPPAITQPLLAQTITAGGGATFTVAATGTPAPTYAWTLNGSAVVSGAFTVGSCTGASAITAGGTNLSLANVALGCNGATVSVVASNAMGTSSPSSAALNVNAAGSAPTITTQPVGLTVANGGGGAFSLIVTGTPTPTVTWRIGSTALSSSPYNVGGCSFSYTTLNGGQQLNLSGVTLGCSGSQFSALVSNSAGSVTSNTVALTVLNVAPPTITVPPVAASTTVGGSASFSVTASGSAPLSYVWTLNGAALPASGGFSNGGCTADLSSTSGGASITLSNVSAACNNAAIVVTVSNGNAPDATSAPVTLSVLSAPSSLGACFGGPNGWCYVQPVPMANTLTGLAFDAVGDGVTIVGYAGTVLRSTDRLATVSTSWLAPRYDFSSLVSPSPSRLLAAVPYISRGSSQGLYLSTDAGASWTRIPDLDAPAGIAFKDAQVGVAVGSSFIARTSDGGSTWTRLDVPAINTSTAVSPSGVAYAGRDVDGNDVFVASGFQSAAGAPDGGLRSTDNGLTWSVVPGMAVASGRLTDVVFNGQGVGLAMNDDQQAAAHSTDFGATWTQVTLPFVARRAAFGGANTVVILGESSVHAHSADGGQTWSPQARSLRNGYQEWRPYMRDANEGVAIGLYGAIARTLDGGASWQAVTNGNINDNVSALEANPNRTVLLGQINNGLRRSTDGLTWNEVSAGNLFSGVRHSISWGSEAVAIAATNFEGVHLTTDAGNTWMQVRQRSDTGTYTAVAMANAQTALVSGYDVVNGNVVPFVERSTDAGQTWNRLALAGLSGSGLTIYAARFVSATLGFIAGSAGTPGSARLWRTEDAGATWLPITLPDVGTNGRRDIIWAIQPGPSGTVFMATDSALLRSADSGFNWQRVLDANAFGSMTDVGFSGTVGIAVGFVSVWRSTDSGATWTRLDLPIDSYGSLSATAWAPDGSVLVGGDGGALLINRSQGALAARPDNPMFRQSLNLPAAPAAGTVAPPRRAGPAVRPGMPSGAHAPGSREALLLAPPTAPAAAPSFPGAAVVLPKVRTPDRRAPAPESGATAGAARASR
jgi:photosystem II stability/assembly factor-like uncharacterized protein